MLIIKNNDYNSFSLELTTEEMSMLWGVLYEASHKGLTNAYFFYDKVEDMRPAGGFEQSSKMPKKDIPRPVAIDKTKICFVKEEFTGFYLCSGEITDFYVPKDRCVEIDEEYLIILNTKSALAARRWAEGKSYLSII